MAIARAAGMNGAAARETAEAVARRSYGKLVAYLAMQTRDVASAEDALSDAMVAALAEWPKSGCPENPEGWLLTVARRRSIDAARRRATSEAAVPELLRLSDGLEAAAAETTGIPDRRLALMFCCAHPSIDASVRAPLMLQTVLGLEAKTIASAFLTSPATMAKRLVRAKDKIREAGIPLRVPEREELPERMDAVLEAIYAAYTEGWADPAGLDARRRDLTAEALFLARLTAELAPGEPEPPGLVALMLYAESRRRARRDAAGEFVPLAEQDVTLWDAAMVREAEQLLLLANEMGRPGRFQLEAALQSAHAHRRVTGRANWVDVVRLYDALQGMVGSPVIAINRALAVAELDGAAAGLAALPEADARLLAYQPYWAVRAELLTRDGRGREAVEAYEIAIGLERDDAVRSFLRRRQSTVQ